MGDSNVIVKINYEGVGSLLMSMGQDLESLASTAASMAGLEAESVTASEMPAAKRVNVRVSQ